MIIKGWNKIKDNANYIVYGSNKEKDYNENQPKHLQVGEKYRIFHKNVITITQGWSNNIPSSEWNQKNSTWVVDAYSGIKRTYFKTKQEALDFAVEYMKSHPNG